MVEVVGIILIKKVSSLFFPSQPRCPVSSHTVPVSTLWIFKSVARFQVQKVRSLQGVVGGERKCFWTDVSDLLSPFEASQEKPFPECTEEADLK